MASHSATETYLPNPILSLVFMALLTIVLLTAMVDYPSLWMSLTAIFGWLLAAYLLFGRSPRIRITSRGTLKLDSYFRTQKSKVNLLDLQSVSVTIKPNAMVATYICTLVDRSYHTATFDIGYTSWLDRAELIHSIQTAAVASGAQLHGHAPDFFAHHGNMFHL